jgi:hypothetical protein
MSLVRNKKKADATIPEASLADIAFLLLIFFLCNSVFNEE